MSRLRVIGVYDTSPLREKGFEAARQREIITHCKKASLPAPTFESPDFFEATVVAAELAQSGRNVVLVGTLNDLRIPSTDVMRYSAGGFTEHEWREAWLAYLKERALGWSPIDATTDAAAHEDTNRQSVIRSYQRSVVTIARFLARIRSRRKVGTRSKEPGYVYGRPPYGYRVVKGHLEPDQERVELVKAAFKCLQEGKTITDAALALQALDIGRDGKPEYWDPVKIRRILKHASLYCYGEYLSPTGKVVRLPSLAILPKSCMKVAEARAPKAFPRKDGCGTMSELTSTTN